MLQKFRKSYSKKQWISDTIIDKLDRDEEKIEKTLLGARPNQGQEQAKNQSQSQDMSDKEQINLLKNELAELKALLQKN